MNAWMHWIYNMIHLHLAVIIIIVCVYHEVGMNRHRAKFVRCEYEEYVGGHLFKHFVEPNVLKSNGRSQ